MTRMSELNRFLVWMPDTVPYSKHAPPTQYGGYHGVQDDLRYIISDEQPPHNNYISRKDMVRGWSGRYRLRLCEMIARQRAQPNLPKYKHKYLDEIEAQLLAAALEIGMTEDSW